jgi:excisionase family DNA binding protein
MRTAQQFRRWLNLKIEWVQGSVEFNESEHAEAQSLIGQAYEHAISLRLPAAAAVARRGPVRVRLVEVLNALPESTGDLLTVAEAASKFKLGERTIYRMVEQGLPVSRAGRAVRIKLQDLQRFLADSETRLR